MASVAPPPPRDGTGPLPSPPLIAEAARVAASEALFGQSPIGAGIFDSQCRYFLVNDALERIIGRPSAELIGRRVSDVLPDVGPRVESYLRAAMTSGEPLVNQQFVGATYAHDGQPRAFLASYFRLADEDGETMGAASFVVDITEELRTREELAAANDRLALLSRVSGAMASCLDVQDALASFAQLVVPDFADHCVIDLIDEDRKSVHRAALVHAEGLAPDNDAWAPPGSVVVYPEAHPALQAMRSGRAVVEHAADDPDFQHIAPTPESAEYGRRIGVRSAMTAPLVARGEVLGAVSFVTSASGRIFTDSDLGTGEELASRAAIALDNARLYAREQRIALTLQRSLLPSRFPATPALEIAAVYHPAAQDGPVGGDWYDVIALPCGRVGLVMGDVMGRGVPAAALMGQLRAAVRAYAAQDLTPSELLGHLDDLVRGLADDVIVTCIYAVYDPVSSALCLANAGHPPPLLVTPNGAQRIDQHGVVLGAGHANYEQTEIPVDEGTTLVLYTDGLVERRTADLDACIDDLARLAAAQTGNLQQLSTRIATLAVEGPDADDVAVMVVRPLAGQAPRVARFDVVPHARMVRDVRQFADHALTDWGETQATHEAVQLIVSELVTNVIRHADGHEATVQLERHADRIVVSVIDPDGAPPRLARPGPEDEGGRGLHLVQAVTDRWGTRSLPDGGKVVWCELFVSGLAT